METKKEFYNCCWTKWQKNVVLKDKTGRFCDKCHRHRAIRAMEQLRKAVSTVRGLAGTYLGSSQRQNPVFCSDNTFTNASVDDQTRGMDSHEIHCEKGHTNDSVKEDSWKEIQKIFFHWENKSSLVVLERMSINLCSHG